MRQRKYELTTGRVEQFFGGVMGVEVKVTRRGVFRRPSRTRILYVETRSVVSDSGDWFDLPTDAQIKEVAWAMVAEIEFPKPKLEWRKTGYQTL